MSPTEPGERYPALDIIRGVALLGVLLVNIQTLFCVSLFSYILNPPSDFVSAAVARIFEFRSFDLFCLCFGAGVGIQAERNPEPVAFLLRRFGILLLFGLGHLFLVWNGEILTLYAVCGLLLLPFLRLRPLWLGAAGIAWLLLPRVVPFGALIPGESAIRAQAAAAHLVYPNAGYWEILRFRIAETVHFILPILWATLPRAVSLMLIGGAIWRAGVLRKPEEHRRWLLLTVVIGLAAGLVMDFDIPQALAYGAAILLWGRSWSWFAPVGQMALTNYLTQSFILTFLFYGFGLGLFGRTSPLAGLGIGLVLYMAQVLFSHWWIRRFRFGPFEWIWRSLTYRRRQPMAVVRSGQEALPELRRHQRAGFDPAPAIAGDPVVDEIAESDREYL